MNLWKIFKGRYLTDRADSILVPAMILAPVLALLVGITMEIGKNSYVRSERISAIQDAANAAVKTVNSQGSLNWKVVDKVVDEYERNRFGGKKFSSSGKSKLDPGQSDTQESKVFDSFGDCLESSDKVQRYPQYKITLLEGRADDGKSGPSVSFQRTQPSPGNIYLQNSSTLDPKKVYRGVRVDIVDQTPNFMMSMAGAPCQKFDLTASAVTFATSVDSGEGLVLGAM